MKTNIYTCGPTVYDESHLGHAKTYISADLIIRCLQYFHEADTNYVMNITDIDDKIINKANELNINWKGLAEKYETHFFEIMEKLNIKFPNRIQRVTSVIPDIQIYIQKIVDNGFAYVTESGSVYFDSTSYAKAGYQIKESDDYTSECEYVDEKKTAQDFVLWKSRTESEVHFNIDISYNGSVRKLKGRPG